MKVMTIVHSVLMGTLVLPAVTLGQSTPVTFRVNMSVKIAEGVFNTATDHVVVRGSFNGWSGNAQECVDVDGDQIYEGTFDVEGSAGTVIDYKFVIPRPTGDMWENTPNRQFELTGGAITLPVVYFEDDMVVSPPSPVTFRVNMSVKIAEGVFNTSTDKVVVRGSFNDWGGNAQECFDVDGDQVYEGTFDIIGSPGEQVYYKFVIPVIPGDLWEDNVANRQFQLTGDPISLPIVYFDDDLIANSPTATTTPATSVTSTSATLNGNVSLATTAYFEWGTSSTLSTFSTTNAQTIVSGTGSVSVSATLTGLSPSMTYYYRVVVENGTGTQKGSIASFSTLGLITAAVTFRVNMSVKIAEGIFNTSTDKIVIRGSFNGWSGNAQECVDVDGDQVYEGTFDVEGSAGSVIEYKFVIPRPTGDMWENTPNRQFQLTGDPITLPVVYFDDDEVVSTPTVTTLNATAVTATTATLNGSVNPNGFATTAYFEWGTSSTLSTFSTTPTHIIGSGTALVSVSADLADLAAGTTYYFRIVAQNSESTRKGSINSFATVELNQAALFDGSTVGGRIRVLDSGPLNPAADPDAYKITGTAITVEAWIYPMAFPNLAPGNSIVHRPIAVTWDDPGTYRLFVSNSDGSPRAAFSISDGTSGSVITVTSTELLPTFQWTHLASTYDGNALRLYVNGSQKGETSTNISIGMGGVGFYIGRFTEQRFQGLIDEVRLWNVTRTETEIQSTMDSELSGGEAGLAGYWNMNALAAPALLPDQTANHNDLRVFEPTPLVLFNPLETYMVPTFTIAPLAADFGVVEQASSTTRTLTFTNTSAYPLVGILESGSGEVQIGGAFLVSPGEASEVLATARPLVAGTITGYINVRSNAASDQQLPFSITSIALRRFDANNIAMWNQRDGRFAWNPLTVGAGFEWPKGSGKTAIYQSGIWIAAKVNEEIRTACASYNTEFQPGSVVGGVAANPNDAMYRVYKISAGDNAGTNPDYAEWPANLGAPINPDGTPKVIGDQTLFAVYNDLDPSKHVLGGGEAGGFGTPPLGAEVQQTVFGFNQSDSRANTVFVRFKIVNRSSAAWRGTYVGLWSDPDLGNWADDFVGVDVLRSLGFIYNATNTDAVYGSGPPAVGFDFLKGAFFTDPIQAFAYFSPGSPPGPSNAVHVYNFLQGLRRDGSPYVDPTTGMATTFPFSGDPVTSAGWLDSELADKRTLFTTGPFDLEPGQSKELVAAIIVGQGTSNLNSVTALRAASDEIQGLYDGGGIFGGAVENIASVTVPAEGTTTLDDLSNSGAQLDITAGSDGATVEVASYVDPPPGAQTISSSSIGGVGKYLEVQVQGTVEWPFEIRIFYTADDLAQAGVLESDLQGVYYWSGTNSEWRLYSNSGTDDQGRGPSTTSVNPGNIVLDGVTYEGYVSASAYHLTPVTIGAKKKSVAERYQEVLEFIGSLPDGAFKKPAGERRAGLLEKVRHSQSLCAAGNLSGGISILQKDVLNHLMPQGNSSTDVWIVDEDARTRLVKMITDLIAALQLPRGMSGKTGDGVLTKIGLDLPKENALLQNYPNPFNPLTTIRFDLPAPGFVTLMVFDILGRELAVLAKGEKEPGRHVVVFDGEGLPSGVYVYRIEAGPYVAVRKMLLVK